MCNLSEWEQSGILQPLSKSTQAITPDGYRTITGVVAPGDAELILNYYPIMSLAQIEEYIGYFQGPRLYEVLGPIELAYRMLNALYSNIKTATLSVDTQVAYNPLSILSRVAGKVIRITTPQSDLLHQGMEKLNLRQRTMVRVDEMFDRLFGLQIVFACSCGVGAVRSSDYHAPDFVQFLDEREEMGRTFDSDVLSVFGRLYECESISQVPQEVIDGSPDVGRRELNSYARYYLTLQSIITENPRKMDFLTEKQNQFFFN